MPGQYDAPSRTITLSINFDGQTLSVGTLIHFVVMDLLVQNQFPAAHLNHWVDMAVIATGLGVIRNQIDLVSQSTSFWDPTAWEILPPPFLSNPKCAYAHALAAWVRNETSPVWEKELTTELSGPMKKSLKFLHKTKDSLFKGKPSGLAQFDQQQWQVLAEQGGPSSRVIGMKQCNRDDDNSPHHDQWNDIIAEQLRSNDDDIVLHAIAAAERAGLIAQPIVDELVVLAEHNSDPVKAKAALALAQIGKLDDVAIGLAAKMLSSPTKYVIYAGLNALTAKNDLPDQALPAVDRAFARSLANCDQELINLFAKGYQGWVDDPETHFLNLFEEHSPEFVEIAQDALVAVDDYPIPLQ